MNNLVRFFLIILFFLSFSQSFSINNRTARYKNVEVVQNLYSDFAKGDIPAVLQKFDPEIEWNEAENFPYADGNPYIGPNAVLEGVFKRIGTEWDYWNLTEQTYYEASSGEVIVTGRYKAKNKITGKEINVQFVHIWTLEEGMVKKFQQFADTYQTLKAMEAE